MIQIFIYNSCIDKLEIIRQSIVNYLRAEKLRFKIIASIKSSDTLSYIKQSARDTDIFFIDFLEEKTALHITECVQKNNPSALWVYTGESTQHLLKILYLRPSGYINSSMSDKEIQSVFQVLEHQIRKYKQKNFFSFKCEGEFVYIPYDDILYFESNAKKIALIQRKDIKYLFTGKLDEIAERVPYFFVRCHQSYLVNMNSVRLLDSKNRIFILDTNEEIWISKRMISETKNTYLQYIENKQNILDTIPFLPK